MKNLTWQNLEQLLVAQVLIKMLTHSAAEIRNIMIDDCQLQYLWDTYKDYRIVTILPGYKNEDPISLKDLYDKWEKHMNSGRTSLEYFKEYCEDGMLRVSGDGEWSYIKYAFMRIQTYYLYDFYVNYTNSSSHPSFLILSPNSNCCVREIPKTQWKFWVEAMDY